MNHLFVSTTFLGRVPSKIEETLGLIQDLDINGIELGSTHQYDKDFLKKLQKTNFKRKLVHNYCPPAKRDLILNIASPEESIRKASVEHVKNCLQFAGKISAELYTLHPGFLADALGTQVTSENYDFQFQSSFNDYETVFQCMTRSLEEILSYASKISVSVALETEGSIKKSEYLLLQRPEEFIRIKEIFGKDLYFNFNLAHSALAGKCFSFDPMDILEILGNQIKAVEISHCNLENDQHLPLQSDSFVFSYLNRLPKVPWILEFRDSSLQELMESIQLIRSHFRDSTQLSCSRGH